MGLGIRRAVMWLYLSASFFVPCTCDDALMIPSNVEHLPSTHNMTAFQDWLRDNQASFSPFDTIPHSTRNGIILTDTNLKKDEVFMQLPYNLFVTVDVALTRKLPRRLSKTNLTEETLGIDLDHLYLILFLMEETYGFNGSIPGHSFYQPWLNILPQNISFYAGCPITWIDEDVERLKESTWLYDHTISTRESLMNSFSYIAHFVPGFEDSFIQEQYLWAYLIVYSSVIQIEERAGLKILAILPFVDLAASSPPGNLALQFHPLDQAIRLTALDDVDIGNQVTLVNGLIPQGDSPTLAYLGYVPEHVGPVGMESNNTLTLTFPMSPFDQKKSYYHSRRMTVAMDATMMRRTFSYLRYIVAREQGMYPPSMSDAQINAISCTTCVDYDFQKYYVTAFSVENEIHVLKKLVQACFLFFSERSTTLKDDHAALADLVQYPPGSHQRHARLILRGEKEFLDAYMELMLFQIGYLELTWDTFQIATQHMDPVRFSYIRQTLATLVHHQPSGGLDTPVLETIPQARKLMMSEQFPYRVFLKPEETWRASFTEAPYRALLVLMALGVLFIHWNLTYVPGMFATPTPITSCPKSPLQPQPQPRRIHY